MYEILARKLEGPALGELMSATYQLDVAMHGKYTIRRRIFWLQKRKRRPRP